MLACAYTLNEIKKSQKNYRPKTMDSLARSLSFLQLMNSFKSTKSLSSQTQGPIYSQRWALSGWRLTQPLQSTLAGGLANFYALSTNTPVKSSFNQLPSFFKWCYWDRDGGQLFSSDWKHSISQHLTWVNHRPGKITWAFGTYHAFNYSCKLTNQKKSSHLFKRNNHWMKTSYWSIRNVHKKAYPKVGFERCISSE